MNKNIFRYISQLPTLLNMAYALYELMNYPKCGTKDKEVRDMEGITKIEIPEIEGLRETFAESTVICGEGGPDGCGGC